MLVGNRTRVVGWLRVEVAMIHPGGVVAVAGEAIGLREVEQQAGARREHVRGLVGLDRLVVVAIVLELPAAFRERLRLVGHTRIGMRDRHRDHYKRDGDEELHGRYASIEPSGSIADRRGAA